MKLYLTLIILLISASQAVGQVVAPSVYFLPLTYVKTGGFSWAAGGADIAEANNPTAPILNPATLDPTARGVMVEFGGYQIDLDLLPTDSRMADRIAAPTVAIYRQPMSFGGLAVGYSRQVSGELDMPKWEQTTPEQPNGTGVFVDPEFTQNNYTGFMSGSYRLGPKSAIGLTLGVGYWRIHQEVLSTHITWKEYDIYAVLGYQTEFSSGIKLGGSISINREVSSSEDSNIEVVIDMEPPAKSPTSLRGKTFGLNGPTQIKLGGSFPVNDRFTAMLMAAWSDWTEVANLNGDVLDVHLGGQVAVSPAWDVRAGFFTQNYPGDDGFDLSFLTAGVHGQVTRHIGMSLAVMDSHLFPGDHEILGELTQTFFNFGLNYSFR